MQLSLNRQSVKKYYEDINHTELSFYSNIDYGIVFYKETFQLMEVPNFASHLYDFAYINIKKYYHQVILVISLKQARIWLFKYFLTPIMARSFYTSAGQLALVKKLIKFS